MAVAPVSDWMLVQPPIENEEGEAAAAAQEEAEEALTAATTASIVENGFSPLTKHNYVVQ